MLYLLYSNHLLQDKERLRATFADDTGYWKNNQRLQKSSHKNHPEIECLDWIVDGKAYRNKQQLEIPKVGGHFVYFLMFS